MKLVRALFVMLALAVPSSWTIAHAGDDMKKDEMGDKGGEMKKGKKKKGDMDKGEMDKKKGDMGK
jgi:pentapeptide MXKDX repeat protein